MLNPLDLYDVRSLLSEDERAVQDSVGRFVDERVLPIIQECFEKHHFPRELVQEIADLGLHAGLAEHVEVGALRDARRCVQQHVGRLGAHW